MTLALLLACKAEPPKTIEPEDTQAHLIDTAEEDSGIETWTALSKGCEAPSGLPSDPLRLDGQLKITQSNPGDFFVELVDLELDGDTLYGVGQGGLIVYDVADPSNPVKRSVFPNEQAKDRFHRVEALGDGVVAVTHRERGLRILRASDHREYASIVGSGMEGLARVGDRLYVSSREQGLLVYDLRDLEQVVQVTVVPGLSHTWELAATDDGWLYAADNQLGLVPIDLSDPDQPVIGIPVEVLGSALHVRAEGDTLLVSSGAYGVAIYDRSDPAAPTLLGRVETGGSVVMADANEGLLWAVDHEAVTVWDYTDPNDPRPLHRETTEQFALAVIAAPDTPSGLASAWVGDWSILGHWTLDREVQAARLELSSEKVYLGGGERVLELRNHGSATGSLLGWEAPAEGVEVEVSATEVGPGEIAWMRLRWTAEGTYEIPLCLSATDPQEPTRELLLFTGDTYGHIGDPAPDFSLQGLDGETYTLSEQLGHPVVLAYFATW